MSADISERLGEPFWALLRKSRSVSCGDDVSLGASGKASALHKWSDAVFAGMCMHLQVGGGRGRGVLPNTHF